MPTLGEMVNTRFADAWQPLTALPTDSWVLFIALVYFAALFFLAVLSAVRWLHDLIAPAGDFNGFAIDQAPDDYISINHYDLPVGMKTGDAVVVHAKVGKRMRKTQGIVYKRITAVPEGTMLLPFKQFNQLTGADDYDDFGSKKVKIRVDPSTPYSFSNLWNHPELATQVGFRVTVMVPIITTVITFAIEYAMAG